MKALRAENRQKSQDKHLRLQSYCLSLNSSTAYAVIMTHSGSFNMAVVIGWQSVSMPQHLLESHMSACLDIAVHSRICAEDCNAERDTPKDYLMLYEYQTELIPLQLLSLLNLMSHIFTSADDIS